MIQHFDHSDSVNRLNPNTGAAAQLLIFGLNNLGDDVTVSVQQLYLVTVDVFPSVFDGDDRQVQTVFQVTTNRRLADMYPFRCA